MATTLADRRAAGPAATDHRSGAPTCPSSAGFRGTWRGWVATMFGIPVLNLLALRLRPRLT